MITIENTWYLRLVWGEKWPPGGGAIILVNYVLVLSEYPVHLLLNVPEAKSVIQWNHNVKYQNTRSSRNVGQSEFIVVNECLLLAIGLSINRSQPCNFKDQGRLFALQSHTVKTTYV